MDILSECYKTGHVRLKKVFPPKKMPFTSWWSKYDAAIFTKEIVKGESLSGLKWNIKIVAIYS